MNIKRIGVRRDRAEVVIAHGTAYFSAISGDGADVVEQGKAIFRRFDELMAECGLKKENIVYVNSLFSHSVQGTTGEKEHLANFMAWFGRDVTAKIMISVE